MTGRELIKAVINTLEHVEVHGSENMNRLLGCIQTLGNLEQEMTRHEQAGDAALQQRDSEDATGTV